MLSFKFVFVFVLVSIFIFIQILFDCWAVQGWWWATGVGGLKNRPQFFAFVRRENINVFFSINTNTYRIGKKQAGQHPYWIYEIQNETPPTSHKYMYIKPKNKSIVNWFHTKMKIHKTKILYNETQILIDMRASYTTTMIQVQHRK